MRVDNRDSKCGINIGRVLFDVMLELVWNQRDLIRLARNGLRCKLNDTLHLMNSCPHGTDRGKVGGDVTFCLIKP